MRFQIRPKLRAPRLVAALSMGVAMGVAVAATMLAPAAFADELTTPASASAESSSRPARGMSMEKVEATFGAPSQRLSPVGEPPITRWEYPGFVVYFEHQLVIHTVAIG